tara:strand:+ start:650 stop:1072 length:423 start_codon:yes stop_codon:yes gene_type:complete
MQFSTIDEAWGKRKIYNTSQEATETDIKKSSEPTPILKENKINYSLPVNNKKVYFNHTEESLFDGYTDTINDKYERNELIKRVLKSKRCRDVLRKKFSPDLLAKLNSIIEDYRDLFVLVLVGFCILIFLNMMYNINKSTK